MGVQPKGFKVEKGENILWIGKKTFKSLWLPFLLGVLTIFYYIGMILILCTIVFWLRCTYIITDKRVVKMLEYYPIAPNKIQYIELSRLHGMNSTQSSFGKIFGYSTVTFLNNDKIVFKGISHLSELNKYVKIANNFT